MIKYIRAGGWVVLVTEMMHRLLRFVVAGWLCGVHPYGYVPGILVLRYWPAAEAEAEAEAESEAEDGGDLEMGSSDVQ